ncbi:MAG: hypothetical protein ACI978_002378 [Oleispira sp.]|jgi:hypothetical protein
MNEQKTLRDYQGCHEGASIIVCGCGESLSTLPRDNDVITIGVNDVGRLFDPTYLLVLNRPHQFKNNRFNFVHSSRAQAIFSQFNLKLKYSNSIMFTLGKKGGTDFLNPDVLPYTQNSPYVAVCLAALMGAKRIGLSGVDFNDNHFFAATGPHHLNRKLSVIDQQYGQLYRALQLKGIELYNLSDTSQLTQIPKMNSQEFIGNRAVLEQNAKPTGVLSSLRPLNIVHIGLTNCAGALWNLHRMLTKYTGHNSRVITASPITNGRRYPQDVSLHDQSKVFTLISDADVIHFHNRLDKDSPQMRPYRRLLDNKPAVLQFHSELEVLKDSFPGKDLNSRTDIPTLVVAQKQARYFASAIPVQNALDIHDVKLVSELKAQAINTSRSRVAPRVLFAPSDTKSYGDHSATCCGKGYEQTQKILKRLHSEGVIEAHICLGKSWDVLNRLRQSCDIVIDECVTGGYHLTSLEALAQGKVTIAFLDEKTQKLLGRVTGSPIDRLPWINCAQLDLDVALRELVRDRPQLAKRQQYSREWMDRYWKPDSLLAQYSAIYWDAINKVKDKIDNATVEHRLAELPSLSNLMLKKLSSIQYEIKEKPTVLRSEDFRQSISLSRQLLERQGSLQNQVCHILGNGPSLANTNLSSLKDQVVITVNSSALLHKKLGRPADYYCVSDRRFLQDNSTAPAIIDARNCIKVFAGYCEGLLADDTINYVKVCGGDGISLSIEKGFYHNCSVVLFAAQLALWLGCRKIYLHGCEFDYSGGRFNVKDYRPYDAGIYPRVEKNASILANQLVALKGQLYVVGPSRLVGDFGATPVKFIKSVCQKDLPEELKAGSLV